MMQGFEKLRGQIGNRVLVMGILNITPDSFSDGGEFLSRDAAVKHALEMIQQGADILDVGGESTRPGSASVSADEESVRVVGVIEEIHRVSDIPISIDTTKSLVAQAALKAGACVINDISGLRGDCALADLAAETGCGLILMHSRGTPETMQTLTEYSDLIADIKSELESSIQAALDHGVAREQLIVDPGIGFAKTLEQNYELIARLAELKALGYPLLLGPSRKSFIGGIINKPAQERLHGTAAAVTACVIGGADVVRVHDVAEMVDVIRVAQAVRDAGRMSP